VLSLLHDSGIILVAYVLFMVATAAAAAVLGAMVMVRQRGSVISWWFLALCGTVTWWLLGRAMSATAPSAAAAQAWVHASYVTLPFVPAVILQFTHVAVGKKRVPRGLLIATWSTAAILSVVATTTGAIVAGVWRYPWGFYPRYGPAGILFIALLLAPVAVAIAILWSAARQLPPSRQRKRLRQFAIGFAVGSGAGIDFFCAFGITVAPLGHVAVIATIVIIGRAIRKYRLYDITPAFAAKNIVSTMADALVVADDEGHIRIVNDALLTLTGYSQEELDGAALESILPLRAGDTELHARGGAAIPVSISVSPLQEDGRTAGVVVIARDVREQQRIEAALREQDLRLRTEEVRRKAELQYRALVESMREGIVQTDRESIIRYVNDPLLRMLGFTREEAVGRSLFEFVDEQLREFLLTKTELRRRGVSDRYEVEVRTKGGEPLWVEVMGSPVHDLNGEVIGALGILTDVTERRSMQEQLAAGAREWQKTFDAIHMPIVIVDRQGRINRINRAARQYAARDGTAFAGRSLRELGGALWNEVERLVCSVEESARLQFEEPDGGRTWDVVVDVLPAGGSDRQVVVAARDITAVVELQRSLRRSETMSALGALVAGVAHEVRNPLFAISATLDAFEDSFAERKEYRDFAGTMRGQIDRLRGLLSGLLEFGRPAPAALTRRPVGPIIEQAIALCAPEARAAGVDVVYRAAAEPWLVEADERRLLHAFGNVIHNAVQFSPPEGKVVVASERIAHGEGEAWVLCTVSDEGPGFDPADLTKVFEPFFTRREGGTGLGLSIARAVVEQHRGNVAAANREGRAGAVVSLRLPIASQAIAKMP
jgi:PAS domain S-box-containing protein